MRTLVCIVCPNGCRLQITQKGDDIEIIGAKCQKGKDYAIMEITAPQRTLTTTVKTCFKDAEVLPVRTDAEVPKEKIFALMDIINSFVLTERVKRGEKIIENILNTGVNIIATSDILYKEE